MLVDLAAAAATHGSRWYITGGFTTFLVFVFLLYASPQDAAGRFVERVGETALGVGLALFFGWLIPLLRAAARRRSAATRSS